MQDSEALHSHAKCCSMGHVLNFSQDSSLVDEGLKREERSLLLPLSFTL